MGYLGIFGQRRTMDVNSHLCGTSVVDRPGRRERVGLPVSGARDLKIAGKNCVNLGQVGRADCAGALPSPVPMHLPALGRLAALGFAVKHCCEYLSEWSHCWSLLYSNFPAGPLGSSKMASFGERVCSVMK